jgi:hypothetical protein
MARQELRSRDMVLLLGIESALGSGSGASITLAAAVNGAVPVGAATVTSGGTGYPASKTIYVNFTISSNSTAMGTITTGSTGVITAAAVLDGGTGYAHATNTASTIRAANNSAYGSDYVGSSGLSTADAILIGSDMKLTHEKIEVKRDVLRAYMGGQETMAGDTWATISFSFELGGSGVADTPAMWGRIIRILGFAESVTSSTKVDYTPVSDDFPSAAGTLYFGGISKRLKGIRALSAELDMPVAGLPTGKCTLLCMIVKNTPANLPTPTFAAWKPPIVITDANSGDIQFGCTYSTSTGAISGGTSYPSTGLKLKIDNSGKYRALLGGGSGVYISDRKVTGEILIDQLPSERVQTIADWTSNTAAALGFSLGITAGYRLRAFAPNRVITDVAPEDLDGKLMTKIGFECRPTAGSTGNDELRLVTM